MKELHPYTELVPVLADVIEVSHSIATRGQDDPVVLFEGKIIEGRVRAEACLAIERQPQYRDWVMLDTEQQDPLEWMAFRHVETHNPGELERIRLASRLLPHFQELSGPTYIRLNRAIGLSQHKIRSIQWLTEAGKIAPVLAGDQDLLEAARAIGVVSEKRAIALGKSYGAGDRFDEAIQPLKRYLTAWKRKGYEFRHVNPKEAQRRLSVIDSLVAELQAARPDLQARSKPSTLSAPPERKGKT